MTEKDAQAIVKNFATTVTWKEAKTYAKTAPHEYTVRDDETWGAKETFGGMVYLIREYGYQAKFFSKTFTYLNAGEYKYWTMGSPIEETIIINRRRI